MPHTWHIAHTGGGRGWLGNQVGYSLKLCDTRDTERGIKDGLKKKKHGYIYLSEYSEQW